MLYYTIYASCRICSFLLNLLHTVTHTCSCSIPLLNATKKESSIQILSNWRVYILYPKKHLTFLGLTRSNKCRWDQRISDVSYICIIDGMYLEMPTLKSTLTFKRCSSQHIRGDDVSRPTNRITNANNCIQGNQYSRSLLQQSSRFTLLQQRVSTMTSVQVFAVRRMEKHGAKPLE
jgi:hypothetical protein